MILEILGVYVLGGFLFSFFYIRHTGEGNHSLILIVAVFWPLSLILTGALLGMEWWVDFAKNWGKK